MSGCPQKIAEMKKKILGLAVIAMSMVSFSSVAQNTKSNNCAPNADCPTVCQPCPTTPANCAPSKCDRHDPYKGLNLTSTQREKLNQLDADRRQARVDKAQLHKADRLRNDSLRRADRKNYLEEVKAIVGPEQYVIYLENIVLDSPRVNGGHHKAFTKGNLHNKQLSRVDRADNKKFAKNDKRDRKGNKDAKRSDKVETATTTQQ